MPRRPSRPSWPRKPGPPSRRRERPTFTRASSPGSSESLFEAVLAHTGGNQLRAAEILGINRNTLRKKIAELGVALPGRA